MKADYAGLVAVGEVTSDGVAEHGLQFIEGIGLGEDGMAKGTRFVTTLRRFLDGKNDFTLGHRGGSCGKYTTGLGITVSRYEGSTQERRDSSLRPPAAGFGRRGGGGGGGGRVRNDGGVLGGGRAGAGSGDCADVGRPPAADAAALPERRERQPKSRQDAGATKLIRIGGRGGWLGS